MQVEIKELKDHLQKIVVAVPVAPECVADFDFLK
jgi:hypothetical protein